MRSETSVFIISDDDVNGIDGKSTVNFGLQIKNLKLIAISKLIEQPILSTLMCLQTPLAKVVVEGVLDHFQLCPMGKLDMSRELFRVVLSVPFFIFIYSM